MNTAGWVRSVVWVGGIQVEHKQFGGRIGGVMELGQMQCDERTCKVMGGGVGNATVQGRSTIWVGEGGRGGGGGGGGGGGSRIVARGERPSRKCGVYVYY